MKKGNLIVVEGSCDGVGKTTQYNMLVKRFEQDGDIIYNHHFPSYGTYHGLPVEKYLAGEYGLQSELSPYFIHSLYAYDRSITWHTIMKEKYKQGTTILLDRYTTSSLFYQAALIDGIEKKKDFIDYVIDFEYNKLGIKEPDSVIFLYAPFDLVTEMRNVRVSNEGVIDDIHERDLNFMRKVYESALFTADYLSWDFVQCNDGNKLRSREDIHEDVYSLIKKKNYL